MDSGTFGKTEDKEMMMKMKIKMTSSRPIKSAKSQKVKKKKKIPSPLESEVCLALSLGAPALFSPLLFLCASSLPSFLCLCLLLRLFGCRVSNWRCWRRCAAARLSNRRHHEMKGQETGRGGRTEDGRLCLLLPLFLFFNLFFSLLMSCFDKAAGGAAHWSVCHCDESEQRPPSCLPPAPHPPSVPRQQEVGVAPLPPPPFK